ncbi:MAG TPA: GlmU family protein [Bacteroidia bacterium]|jgi:UDP-N-acetylglucosamine diphosphorylase/glucosamine-1-phosphate N-acetyltransferase|nr:GlmU family protein [Bacteroidia bacterium]
MNYILFDDVLVRKHLLPFTFTRPVCDIRIGILTIKEKWEHELKKKVSVKTEEYLSVKYPQLVSGKEDNIWINGSILPSALLLKSIKCLKENQALFCNGTLIAVNSGKAVIDKFPTIKIGEDVKEKLFRIERLWDIFSKNGDAIEQDFVRLTKGRKSAKVSSTNTLIGKRIFIEKGAKLECAILNSTSGPIYIGKNAEIMEGSILKGPIVIGDESVVKAGAKIYGATTIGPHSKVGGEISNSVLFGYSNKGHDGFLGNAVLGEWCNLGADTNNSNLKNNYSEVKLWDYAESKQTPTGLTFCGLIMGDHSKCGINTMFNTGTVVGVSANIYGGNFPPKFVPSFSWGGADGFVTYELNKACETAERVFERRHKKFDKTDKQILAKVFSAEAKYRKK